MSYYLKHPQDIQQRDPATGKDIAQPLTFRFFFSVLLQDKRWTANAKSMRSAFNTMDVVDKSKPGEWMRFQDADGELLKEVADAPQGLRPNNEPGYPSGAFAQAWPFMAAVRDMTTDEPEELKAQRLEREKAEKAPS